MLTGVSRSTDPAEWESQLDTFTRRNKGRLTVLAIDDLRFGARAVESGFVLRSAGYDPVTKRIEVTLGDPEHEARRVTRAIGAVDSIDVSADPSGRGAVAPARAARAREEEAWPAAAGHRAPDHARWRAHGADVRGGVNGTADDPDEEHARETGGALLSSRSGVDVGYAGTYYTS